MQIDVHKFNSLLDTNQRVWHSDTQGQQSSLMLNRTRRCISFLEKGMHHFWEHPWTFAHSFTSCSMFHFFQIYVRCIMYNSSNMLCIVRYTNSLHNFYQSQRNHNCPPLTPTLKRSIHPFFSRTSQEEGQHFGCGLLKDSLQVSTSKYLIFSHFYIFHTCRLRELATRNTSINFIELFKLSSNIFWKKLSPPK